MPQPFRRTMRGLLCLLVVMLSAWSLVAGTSLQTAPDENWVAPTDRALHNLGPVNPIDTARSYDCTPLSYRLRDDLSQTMHDGCFITAAFGLVDPDASVAIFTGTDEAEPIKYGGQPAALNILPYSAAVARFGGFPVEGTYMYLYTYFPAALEDERDLHLNPYKNIVGNPNFTVTDNHGQPLAVNPSAMAYASRGQWLVTESPGGALVRINLATFDVMPFAPSFDVPGKPYASHAAAMAVSEDGRYVAVASNEFNYFTVYDLKNCGPPSSSNDLAPEACQSYNYWPYLKAQINDDVAAISHLHFINDGLVSFDAQSGHEVDSYELSPSGPITSLISYLGLGDSYASGEGSNNYLPTTDNGINNCHLSSHSYPLLLNGDLFGNSGHSVACSGAMIHDIASTSSTYTGQTTDQRNVSSREADASAVTILHDFTPGYLSQQTFVESYQPNVITVQVGGDDVGFRDMLVRCLSPLASVLPPKVNTADCYSSYEDRLEVEQTVDRTYGKWLSLYRQLRTAAPAAHIFAIGYPQVVDGAGTCGLNVQLSANDIAFSRDVINYINSVMRRSAQAAGVGYIDISDALKGHELCDAAGSEAGMNGLTAGTDIYHVLGKGSYHPTAYGQALIEQAILNATDHFKAVQTVADPNLPAPTPNDGDTLLQAPKSGRQINTIVPDPVMTGGSAPRGGTLPIAISASDGLQPGSTVSITLGDVNIGTIRTDGSGQASGTVAIPGNTNPGTQPINATGTSDGGTPVTITQVIYVTDTSNDYDGDGIPNAQDSCPYVKNSGIDANHNGIDDVCDTAPASGGTTSPLPPDQTALPTTSPPTTSSDSGQTINSSGSPAGSIIMPVDGSMPDTDDIQPADQDDAETSGGTAAIQTASMVPGDNKPLATGLAVATPTNTALATKPLTVKTPQQRVLLQTLHTWSSSQPYKTLRRIMWYVWLSLLGLICAVWLMCRARLKRQAPQVNYRQAMYG